MAYFLDSDGFQTGLTNEKQKSDKHLFDGLIDKLGADLKQILQLNENVNTSEELRDEPEIARNNDFLYNDNHMINSSVVSLTSDISNDSIASVHSLILNDNGPRKDYQLMENFDLTKALLFVFNIDDCSSKVTILPKRPYFPPTSPGVYIFVINGSTTSSINDVYPDALTNWKQRRYYDVGISKDTNGAYYSSQRPQKPHDYSGRIMQVENDTYPVKMKVISSTSTTVKKPTAGTFVVVVYEITKQYELPEKPRTPPLNKDIIATAQQLLHHNTAKGVLNDIMDSNFMGTDATMLPNIKQLENIASRMPDRTPVRPQGAPRHENRELISKMVKDNVFIKAHHITPTTERILLCADASLSLLIKCLVPKTILVNLARGAQTIKNSGLTMQYESAKKYIESKDYLNLLKSSIFSVDTTFLMSRLYVTIMMFTAPHILNDLNEPAKFVGPIMQLSRQDASKGSSSRRTGPTSTRNRKRKISEIRDTSTTFNNNDEEISIVDEIVQSPTHSHIIPRQTFSQPPTVIQFKEVRPFARATDRLPRPPAAKTRKVEVNETPSDEVKSAYKNYYQSRADKPIWCNYYPFEIAKVSTLSNYKDRKCVHCQKRLGNSKDNIIITHYELYNFTMGNSNIVKQTSGLRAICAENPCMFARYPYITEACFFSNLSHEEAQLHLNEIFNII
uniref:Uncharacterized protein n=1 Tax=Panagrolaimus davidi TaxID=227884 RepID=A0A914P4L2_9BILA